MGCSKIEVEAAPGSGARHLQPVLLFLVVMVMMTLSIGSRVRDKLELDNLAEVAAYNDAVMVSRTFNTVSLLNRAMISHMVALAGVQSLISWAGMYRGALGATSAGLEGAKSPYAGQCEDGMGCGCASKKEIEGLEKSCSTRPRASESCGTSSTPRRAPRRTRFASRRCASTPTSCPSTAQLLEELADQRPARALVAQAKRRPALPRRALGAERRGRGVREVNLNNAPGASPASAQDLGAIAGPLGQGGNGFMNDIAPGGASLRAVQPERARRLGRDGHPRLRVRHRPQQRHHHQHAHRAHAAGRLSCGHAAGQRLFQRPKTRTARPQSRTSRPGRTTT